VVFRSGKKNELVWPISTEYRYAKGWSCPIRWANWQVTSALWEKHNKMGRTTEIRIGGENISVKGGYRWFQAQSESKQKKHLTKI